LLTHDLHVLALDRLFDEHWLMRLERLDQQFGGLRTDGAVEVDSDIRLVASRRAQSGKLFGGSSDEAWRFHDSCRSFLEDSGFQGREAFGESSAHVLGSLHMGIDANPMASRTAQQFVHGDAKQFALDVPQGHIDSADRAGQYGAATIESVTVHGLPVMGHGAGVLADQVSFQLLDSRCTSQRPPLDNRFAQPGDSCIGVNFQKQPSRSHQHGLQAGDPYLVAHPAHRTLRTPSCRVLVRVAGATFFLCSLTGTAQPGGASSRQSGRQERAAIAKISCKRSGLAIRHRKLLVNDGDSAALQRVRPFL
jgi:hypothetical protein